jgi:dynein heavy chain, axonemal
MPLPIAWH